MASHGRLRPEGTRYIEEEYVLNELRYFIFLYLLAGNQCCLEKIADNPKLLQLQGRTVLFYHIFE